MSYVPKDIGLILDGGKEFQNPVVYPDVDWPGACKTRKSMSGIIAMINGSAVALSAGKQKVVALSLMEAE